MNRLKDLACYLSGPIDYAENLGCQWRNEIAPFIEEKNVKVFDPLKHCFHGTHDLDTVKRPLMEKLQKEGRYDELREEIKDINHWDLRCVDLSSFLVVNYDINTFTCGTHEEIFKANEQNKPVLLMIGKDKMNKLPKWMHGRFPNDHFFESWDAIREYLTDIDSNPDYEFTKADDKRWLFFDGDHMSRDYTPEKPEYMIKYGS